MNAPERRRTHVNRTLAGVARTSGAEGYRFEPYRAYHSPNLALSSDPQTLERAGECSLGRTWDGPASRVACRQRTMEEPEATFRPGDTVRLKSGGPVMTVSFEEHGSVACQWFSGPKLEQSRFPATSLELAEPTGATVQSIPLRRG
ncbi:MAG: DUF2158 domain-containing protein [Vicinamibacteria bacterium]